MRQLLRDLEGNQIAILVSGLAFLLLVLVIYVVAVKLVPNIDGTVFGLLGGAGTGNHVSAAMAQASQARSANYQPPSAIAAGVLPANTVQGGGSGPVGMG